MCSVKFAQRVLMVTEQDIGNGKCQLLSAVDIVLLKCAIKSEEQVCSYHTKRVQELFCQSLWIKIQALGLAERFKRRRSTRQIIRTLMALCHLQWPWYLVQLKCSGQRQSHEKTCRSLHDFITYVQNTYIRSTFPISMWNSLCKHDFGSCFVSILSVLLCI